MLRKQVLTLGALVALSVLSGCSPTCGPGNCSGCCSTDGVCETAATNHCGQGGASCKACPVGQTCLVGQCAFPGGGTVSGGIGGVTSGTSGASTGSSGTTSSFSSIGGSHSSSSGGTSGAASSGSHGASSGSGTTTASSTGGTTVSPIGSSSGAGTTTGGPTSVSSSAGTTGGPTTASSGTTGAATSSGGTTGTTGTIPCQITDLVSARDPSVAPYTDACLSGLVVVMQNSYGTPKADGGTQFDGKYFLVDPNTGEGIFAFKAKALPALNFDPARGDQLHAEGALLPFPQDAGIPVQLQLTTRTLTFTNQQPGTIPTPDGVAFSQLDAYNGDEALIGHYVTVPPGSYTIDTQAAEFHSGNFFNGVKLTDGSGNTVLVDTFTFKFSSNNCYQADGGLPPVPPGGFNGVYDRSKMADGVERKIIYFGHCGQ